MQQIEITDLCGEPPFSFRVCDYTITTCYLVASAETSVPIFIDIPEPLQNTFRIIVEIIDGSGCSEFKYYDATSPTPTLTPTKTLTATPVLGCRCIVFENTSNENIYVGFIQCDGTNFFAPIESGTTYYACGSNPYVTNTGVTFNIYTDCIDGSCPRIPFPITPTVTPSLSVTQTQTPSSSVTPSQQSPTPTKTLTRTPRVTNSPTPAPFKAYLFIEPNTGSTVIGDWMYTVNSLNFFGFSNGSQPSQNQSDFNTELNTYVNFSGWTAGTFPSIIVATISKTTGGNDSFGNSIVANNFTTTVVSANTLNGSGWFIWMIPTGATGGLYQSQIDYSLSSPNLLTSVYTESTIYNYTFNYTGSTLPQTTYRVYTTFPGVDFNLTNSVTNIYFRGNSLS
jgi:hypothetical protein